MDAADALRDFIINELHWNGRRDLLTPEYPLIEHHVIDSLGMLTLVAFIEEHFGVMVDDAELLPENFGTIATMTALIDAKRSAAPSAR